MDEYVVESMSEFNEAFSAKLEKCVARHVP